MERGLEVIVFVVAVTLVEVFPRLGGEAAVYLAYALLFLGASLCGRGIASVLFPKSG